MTKSEIIDLLNKTDDYKSLGFTCAAHDGTRQLLTRPCGCGVMQIARTEVDGDGFYDDDIDGWYPK
jgi:hypothetical protein